MLSHFCFGRYEWKADQQKGLPCDSSTVSKGLMSRRERQIHLCTGGNNHKQIRWEADSCFRLSKCTHIKLYLLDSLWFVQTMAINLGLLCEIAVKFQNGNCAAAVSSRDLPFIPNSPLKCSPQTQTILKVKALVTKEPQTCVLQIPASVLLSHKCTARTPTFRGSDTDIYTQTHIRTCIPSIALAPTHANTHTHTRTNLPPPRRKSHSSLPRISCSLYIMLKWTHIIALAWFLVFVGCYQQPAWWFWQRWSLLQAPQIYIKARSNLLFSWGSIVRPSSVVWGNYRRMYQLTFSIMDNFRIRIIVRTWWIVKCVFACTEFPFGDFCNSLHYFPLKQVLPYFSESRIRIEVAAAKKRSNKDLKNYK